MSGVDVVIDRSNQGTHSIEAEFSCDMAMWSRILQSGWFGARDEVLGPIFGGAFDATSPLEVTVRLADEHLEVVAMLTESAEEVVDYLAHATAGSACRREDHWMLQSVMQRITPRAQRGLTTSYFRGRF